ncbi:MAG: hypothetical protein M3R25_09340 [Bacteroidota bacterium]|nr:hypothetical protein [Bacteroidota bacterium]
MSILFWFLWILDLLLAGLILGGSGFRASFGASTDLNSMYSIILIVILVGSLIVRFILKQPAISLIIAAMPMFTLICMYLFEKKTKYE